MQLNRGMTDEQFRQLRQLILDQSVKIEALALEVRTLRKAVETTEVVYVAEPVDLKFDDATGNASAIDRLTRR